MNQLRGPGLKIDDPLTPGHAVPAGGQPAEPTAQTRRAKPSTTDTAKSERQRQPNEPPRPASADQPNPRAGATTGPSDDRMWREWSGISGVGSFRIPHELLVELGDIARELQLPIGMIVTAAITQLLDQPSEQIAALVDKADDARIHGRRTARRRLGQRTDG